MRKSLLAAISLVTSSLTLFAAGIAPAGADPASTARASAYGLSATGLLPISPTITTAAAQPPGQDTQAAGPAGSPSLLTVPLGTLALAAVVGVNANAHQADDIVPSLVGVPQDTTPPDTSNPVALTPVNARGLAKTTGLGLLFTSDNPLLNPVLTLMQSVGGLLTADAISAEAVAKCVNNQPVFETGFQVAGLGGLVGAPLNPVVQQVLDLLGTLGLLGPDAVLSDIISIVPGVVTQTATSVAVDGLVIDILNGTERIVISHAEAHMPAGCGVVAPPTTRAAAPPGGRLAATGNDTPLLPIGAGLMGAGIIGYAVVRRSRRTAVQ